MNNSVYVKITIWFIDIPQYELYYKISNETWISYKQILDNNFSIRLNNITDEELNETMVTYEVFEDKNDIEIINKFISRFPFAFDILALIYDKVINKLIDPTLNNINISDDDSSEDYQLTEAKNNLNDVLTDTENITTILNNCNSSQIKQILLDDPFIMIRDQDVMYHTVNTIFINDKDFCMEIITKLKECCNNKNIMDMINNETENDIPLLFKLIKNLDFDLDFAKYLFDLGTDINKIDPESNKNMIQYIECILDDDFLNDHYKELFTELLNHIK